METIECRLDTQMQWKALSAITAPPFIGNVVSSLIGLNHAGERKKLDEALVHFGKMFPYLSETSCGVSLGEELHFLEHYFSILKMRYGDRFGFHIRADNCSMEIRRFGLFNAAEPLVRQGLEKGSGTISIVLECRCTSVLLRMIGAEIPSVKVEKLLEFQ